MPRPKPVRRTVPTSLRIDPDLRDDLRAEADRRRWGVSKLIVVILEEWNEWRKKQEEKRGAAK